MIRGTTHQQDARFSDKVKKMLQKSQWPDKYDIKIDLTRVDLELIKCWIQKKLISILGQQDDIISMTIISIIDQTLQKGQKLNAKTFHVAISGFLLEKTLIFVSQLWDLLDQAQRSARGIPKSLLQQKKKSQQQQQKKLDQLNAKRYKINNNKFNNVVKRFTNNRNDYRQRQRQRQRQEKIDKKRRDRSRSRSHKKKKSKYQQQKHKKRRSRSPDKKNRQQGRHKKSRRSSSSSRQKKQRQKSQKKRRVASLSENSNSSDVVSSSESNIS